MSAARSGDAGEGPRGRRSVLRALLFVVVSVGLAGGAGELLVRLAPWSLPRWYVQEYPWWGVEFFRPGVLARTPLDAVPVPSAVRPYVGRPPHDLATLYGMFDASQAPYVREGLHTIVPADSNGFPNATVPERAGIVLVGDSFAYSAGISYPPGLATLLEESTNRTVYVAAQQAIGPQQVGWLLEHQALPLQPQLVVWIFFGGNDVSDAQRTRALLESGARMFADVPGYVPPPASRLFGLLRRAVGGPLRPAAALRPLPPAWLPSPDGPATPQWFSPPYLRDLARSADDWRQHPGLDESFAAVARGARLCAEAGSRLVLLFVPSKEQVFVPFLQHDAARIEDMAFLRRDEPPPVNDLRERPTPSALREESLRRAAEAAGGRPGAPRDEAGVPRQGYAVMRRNADVLERLVAEFCEQRGIAFLSATGPLRALAARGRSGFYPGDTHWNPEGQRVTADPLLRWIEENLSPPAGVGTARADHEQDADEP